MNSNEQFMNKNKKRESPKSFLSYRYINLKLHLISLNLKVYLILFIGPVVNLYGKKNVHNLWRNDLTFFGQQMRASICNTLNPKCVIKGFPCAPRIVFWPEQ